MFCIYIYMDKALLKLNNIKESNKSIYKTKKILLPYKPHSIN